MIRVVPDTNIIISAIFWSGKPYRVLIRGLAGEYQLVTSHEIIEEVTEKLRLKFRFPEDKIEEQSNIMLNLFHVIKPSTKVDIIRDKNDNKIIECAIDGSAEFIVTGDVDLLVLKEYMGVKIITASEFLRRIM